MRLPTARAGRPKRGIHSETRGRGRPTNWRADEVMRNLVALWERQTGKKPTIRPAKKKGGSFVNFCKAVIDPIYEGFGISPTSVPSLAQSILSAETRGFRLGQKLPTHLTSFAAFLVLPFSVPIATDRNRNAQTSPADRGVGDNSDRWDFNPLRLDGSGRIPSPGSARPSCGCMARRRRARVD